MSQAYYKISELLPKKRLGQQAELIINAVGEGEANAKTVTQIAEEIKEKLITRQTPERVVMFYLSSWKKEGFIKTVTLSHAPASAALVSALNVIQNVDIASRVSPAADFLIKHVGPGIEMTTGEITSVFDPSVPVLGTPAFPAIAGKKLSESVLLVIDWIGEATFLDVIHNEFLAHNHQFSLPQVRAAVQNLVRQGRVKEHDDKSLEIAK
jgi:hypothetical protein